MQKVLEELCFIFPCLCQPGKSTEEEAIELKLKTQGPNTGENGANCIRIRQHGL
jgi:hypothetical protein